MSVHVCRRIQLVPLALSSAVAVAVATAACGASPDVARTSAARAAKPASALSHEVSSGRIAGLPRYFADIVHVSGSVAGAGPLQIRSATSGKLVVRQPGYDALAIAAYGEGTRLVIAQQAGDRCASRLYRATLSADGGLGRLARFGPVIHGIVASVAADANASVIGYFAGPCSKSASGGYLAVLNARTGQVRRWTGVAMYGSGGSIATGTALSMSASGRVIVFTGEALGSGGKFIGQRVWALRTSASAGPLSARIRTVLRSPSSGPALSAAVLSPDGKIFYLCTVATKGTVSAHRTATQTAVITARRTSSGARTGTVAKLVAARVTWEGFGCPMALTPNGRFLLAPYKLRFGKSSTVPPVVSAEVLATSGPTRRFLSFRLPGSAGPTGQAVGVSIAW